MLKPKQILGLSTAIRTLSSRGKNGNTIIAKHSRKSKLFKRRSIKENIS
jgi:hypothetical protein